MKPILMSALLIVALAIPTPAPAGNAVPFFAVSMPKEKVVPAINAILASNGWDIRSSSDLLGLIVAVDPEVQMGIFFSWRFVGKITVKDEGSGSFVTIEGGILEDVRGDMINPYQRVRNKRTPRVMEIEERTAHMIQMALLGV